MGKLRAAKKTRRARGTGSIFPDKRRGGWVAKVIVGRVSGKLVYRRVTGATQAEVVAGMKSVAPLTSGDTLSDWCDRWIKTVEVRAQSKDDYEAAVRLRIKPALGAMRLSAITPYDIEAASRQWAKSVGAATIRKTLAVLSSALQAAHRADLVIRNAARPAKKPRSPQTKIDPFTPAELLRIVEAGLTCPEWRTFAVCAAIGCRIGEAMALAPESYDAAAGRVTISRTRTRRHGYGPPKSARGARTVKVPVAARAVFEAGTIPTTYTTAHARWKRLLEHLGLRHRNPHQLRHSVITHAIAGDPRANIPGAPIANVARDVGDTVEVIVRTYLHATDDGRDVCAAMDRLFGA